MESIPETINSKTKIQIKIELKVIKNINNSPRNPSPGGAPIDIKRDTTKIGAKGAPTPRAYSSDRVPEWATLEANENNKGDLIPCEKLITNNALILRGVPTEIRNKTGLMCIIEKKAILALKSETLIAPKKAGTDPAKENIAKHISKDLFILKIRSKP